jgi:hypothetical protein
MRDNKTSQPAATGFTAAEVLWLSGMQAGFYAIK